MLRKFSTEFLQPQPKKVTLVSYKKLAYKKVVLGSSKCSESSVLRFSNLRNYTLVSYKKLVYKKVVEGSLQVKKVQ